jgi:regulatory protein
MPKKILALRMGRNGRTGKVEVDGDETFPLAKSSAAGLQRGQLLKPEEIERVKRESRLEDAYTRCLALLARRPRSGAEFDRYLRGRKLAAAEVEQVLARLSERGWIDDRAFARVWVENRQEFRPRSKRALQMELRRFGISEENAREALDEVQEGQAAIAAARKKGPRLFRSVQKHPQAQLEFQRKLTAHLASRGFDYELSRETARSIWEECSRAGECGTE